MLVYQRMALIFLVWSFSLFDRRLDLPSHLGFLRVTVTQIYRLQVFLRSHLLADFLFGWPCKRLFGACRNFASFQMCRFVCKWIWGGEICACFFLDEWRYWISITTNGYKLPAILLPQASLAPYTNTIKYQQTRLRRDRWPVGGGGTFILHGRHLQIFAISLHICAGGNLSFTFLLRHHTPPHTPPLYIYIYIRKLLEHVINVASRASSEWLQHVINVASRASSKVLPHVTNVASRASVQVTATCYQRSIKSVFRVTSTCYQSSIKSVFQGTSTC